jgi:spore germination cell wall hydrolase CwlJ-like protein
VTRALASLDPRVWRIAIAALLVATLWVFARPMPPVPALPAPATQALPEPAGALPPPVPDAAAPLPFGAEAARLSNAQVPIADPAPAAAAPFHFAGDPAARLRARDCLAAAAWYEAGDDPPGERAVVQVVLNRARHPAFPAGICAVVFQGAARATGCQFTFTCDGALARTPSPAALLRARAIAEAALDGAVDARIGLATHYHADYVVPRWRDEMVKLARQGAHLFYRWPGYWGSAAALTRKAGEASERVEPALAALSAAHAPDAPALTTAQSSTASAASIPPPAAPLEPDLLDLQLDPAAAPGSYALRALALCGKRGECRVAGRIAQDLAFLYVRRGGGEGAYWDCTRFPRSDPAQCLPGSGALRRLLAAN